MTYKRKFYISGLVSNTLNTRITITVVEFNLKYRFTRKRDYQKNIDLRNLKTDLKSVTEY